MQAQHTAQIEYAIPKCVTKELLDNEETIHRKQRHNDILSAAATFVAMINERAPQPTRMFWTGYTDLTLQIFVPTEGFTVEASPRLAALLEFLSDNFKEPPTSIDVPNAGQRMYEFERDEGAIISVSVIAELAQDSANCQRILTGTQRVKSMQYVEIDEPVYAFKC